MLNDGPVPDVVMAVYVFKWCVQWCVQMVLRYQWCVLIDWYRGGKMYVELVWCVSNSPPVCINRYGVS